MYYNVLFILCSLQGVWGFITGGLVWFAIPFSLATTMGLAYLGMSSAQGAPLLSEKDVSAGKKTLVQLNDNVAIKLGDLSDQPY